VGTSQGVDDDFTMTSRDPRSGNTPPNRSPNGGNDNSPIDFGDDSGPYPRDGECEDPRFSGEGMAFDQYLTDDNVFRDATDCRNLLAAGRIEFTGYRDRNIVTIDDDQYDFGDDNGAWPRDGECDDPRFSGPGMAAESSLSEDNYFHDATDCRNALAAGTIEFSGYRDLDRGGGGNGANDTQGRSGGFWNGLFNVLNSALDAYTTYQEGVNASQGGDSGGSDSDGGGGDSGCGLTAADRAEGRVCTAN
jgi:hypothetical protein